MNHTAITDPVDVVTLHLLDCAALLRMEDFRGKRVVDVGTGAALAAASPAFGIASPLSTPAALV